MTEEELPTAHNARVLECSECLDLVVPSHQLTLDEMNGTDCEGCETGTLRIQRRNVVRRKDVESREIGAVEKVRLMANTHWGKDTILDKVLDELGLEKKDAEGDRE